MTDLALVAALEKRMFNAWPAVETLVVDDWLVRWANGYSRRANSASAIAAGADLSDEAIDAIEARFRFWGGRVCFRLSPLAASGIDARLAARGYDVVEPTHVMVAPADGRFTQDPRVDLAPAPPPGWLAANSASYGGVKADTSGLAAIVARIRPPAAFATLTSEGAPAAWGIAVVERGYVALQDIVVDPARRQAGLGRALVTSLIAWGAATGARHAYLQVAAANTIARPLYASLGFADAYVYTHRMRD